MARVWTNGSSESVECFEGVIVADMGDEWLEGGKEEGLGGIGLLVTGGYLTEVGNVPESGAWGGVGGGGCGGVGVVVVATTGGASAGLRLSRHRLGGCGEGAGAGSKWVCDGLGGEGLTGQSAKGDGVASAGMEWAGGRGGRTDGSGADAEGGG